MAHENYVKLKISMRQSFINQIIILYIYFTYRTAYIKEKF